MFSVKTNLLIINVLFLFFAICFSAELITDSDFYINYDKSNLRESWQYWKYDCKTHDYNGSVVPAKFVYISGKGYRRKGAARPGKFINVIVIKGKRVGNKILFKGSVAYRSRLEASALHEFLSSVSSLRGVFYDNGKIFIIGDKKTEGQIPIIPADIVVAFRAIANTPYRGAAAVINFSSMGAYAPPAGAVSYEGMIDGTHIGQVLFEADRLLKSIALGCDNIDKKAFEVNREWYMNKFDFIKMPRKGYREKWHRFWFLVDNMKIYEDKKLNAMQFKNDKLHVAVQRRKTSGSYYFEKKSRTAEGRFTDHFNNYLANYENQYPVLYEMTEIAKLIAIVKWLYLNGVIVKFDKEQLEGFYSRYTPHKTPVIRVSKTRTHKVINLRKYKITEFRMASIGGVDIRNFKWKRKNLKKFIKAVKLNSEYVVFRLF